MSKGDSFERDRSRALSLWWSDGERDDLFWRNRTRITSNTPNKERQLGDLTTVHTDGIPFIETFNVEFKIGYSKTRKGVRHKVIPWDLLDLIDGKGRVFIDFWDQTTSDAFLSQRIPMLIFKRDHHSPVVAMYAMAVRRLEELNGRNTKYPFLTVNIVEHTPIELYGFDEFFRWLRPDVVKLYANILKAPKQSRILRRNTDASISGDS